MIENFVQVLCKECDSDLICAGICSHRRFAAYYANVGPSVHKEARGTYKKG